MPASYLHRLISQVHHVQKIAAKEHEGQQNQKSDQAFTVDHLFTPFRFDLFERADEQRNIAERIGNQDQQDRGGNERSLHGGVDVLVEVMCCL